MMAIQILDYVLFSMPGALVKKALIDKGLGKDVYSSFDSGIRLCSMRDFIGYTFTVKTKDELLKGIPSAIRQRIVRGEVVPGMDRRQVELAYGPVPGARTPDPRNETWVYWTGDTKTIRLVFRGDKVRQILEAGL